MKLTKQQITALKKANKKAEELESKLSITKQQIAYLIEYFTGVDGVCDFLPGDGFGFTPISNNRTHISIDELIQHAEKGTDITENFILENLSL